MNASDSPSIYDHMQAAVDIVGQSPHPTSKVAATIAGEGFAFSYTNHWPQIILDTIGQETRIGNSSGTIHAETYCIFSANKHGHPTKHAAIFVTDPPCPNCMKNIAEAGINKLYIDHKGFDKDWANRRGDQFEAMSMRIAEKAGIDVFVLYRKEQRFEIISKHHPNYKPSNEDPASIKTYTDWKKAIDSAHKAYPKTPFALAFAKDKNSNALSLLVDSHPTIGYTSETVENKQGKYSFILQPLNRLLMIAAREGLKLDSQHIYSSRTPTSRELVNFIGAGQNTITIGNPELSRDEHGPAACKTLKEYNLLNLC